MPNWLPVEAARAVAFQAVTESGYLIVTRAVPSASVLTSGCQKIVERKSERTSGSITPDGPAVSAAAPDNDLCSKAIAAGTAATASPARSDLMAFDFTACGIDVTAFGVFFPRSSSSSRKLRKSNVEEIIAV